MASRSSALDFGGRVAARRSKDYQLDKPDSLNA
jgi:hypothetical protein